MLPLALPIATQRLILRRFTLSDLPAFAEIHASPEVARYLYWEPQDEQTALEVLQRKFDPAAVQEGSDGFSLAATLGATGELIGDVSLFRIRREHLDAELGYIIHPDHQGRGYAGEATAALLDVAFRGLGLHRVYGRCDARNDASARLMERLGMRCEAHFRQNEWVKGEWCDELVYAVLADEWQLTSR